MGPLSLTSLVRWVRRYPCWKWLGWILCWTPFSFSQGLLECKSCLRQILILSMSFVFVSVSSSFTMRWVSSFASEVGSTSCLVALPSVACFVSSRNPTRLSQVARCFQTLWVSSSSLGCCGCCCCCCCLPITLQRDLRWWPWCCESFEKYSISVMRSHLINAISWHCCVGDDCK